MSETSESQKTIEDYLCRVVRSLHGLPQNEVDEFVAELRSHIQERAAPAGTMTDQSVQDALGSLGKPESLARMYRAECMGARAIAIRSPWLAFKTALLWAFLSVGGLVVFTVSLVGYLMGIDLILSAGLRPWFPENIGIWWGAHPFMLDMGAHWPAPPGANEIVAWWVSPVLLLVGTAFIFGTHLFTLACIRRFRRLRVADA